MVQLGITFAVFTIIIAVVFFLISRRFSTKHTSNTSRLLNWKQVKREQRSLRDRYFYTKKEKGYYNDRITLPISQNIKLTENGSYEHICAIVPTGGGKTSSVLLPQLVGDLEKDKVYEQLKDKKIEKGLDNASAVVTDPKGEIYRATAAIMQAKGYLTPHLDLTNPEKSIRYNLLQGCKTFDDVRKLAETILASADEQWAKLSRDLLEAFLFRSWEKGEGLAEVIEAIANSSDDTLEMELELFAEAGEEAQLAFKQFTKTAKGDGFVSSVFATINGQLSVFKYNNLRHISNEPNFSFDMLREKKVILYISYPEDEAAIYQPFLASFYFQLMNQVKSHPSFNQGSNRGQKGYPVFFLLDEFANIGKLPDIDSFLSTIRSKAMCLEIFIQSYAQLSKQYGDKVANIIIENCKTKLTMAGVTNESAELFSKLAGQTMVESTSVSLNGGNSVSTSTSKQAQQVVTADDIRRMKKYDLFIVSANLRPIKDDKMFIYYDKWDFWFLKHFTFLDEDKAVDLGRKIKKLIGKK